MYFTLQYDVYTLVFTLCTLNVFYAFWPHLCALCALQLTAFLALCLMKIRHHVCLLNQASLGKKKLHLVSSKAKDYVNFTSLK